MIIRVEKFISINGQEIRKTAEAEIPDDHPRMDGIAVGLMRSISAEEKPEPLRRSLREVWVTNAITPKAFWKKEQAEEYLKQCSPEVVIFQAREILQ